VHDPPEDDFTVRLAKAEELRNELRAKPVLSINGVVGPLGVSAARSGGQPWEIKVTLLPWRVVGGPLEDVPLAISRYVEPDEIDRFRAAAPACSAVRLTAHLSSTPIDGSWRAELEQTLGLEEDDRELLCAAAKLREPVSFEHPAFGAFSLDRALARFSTACTWLNRDIELILEAENEEEAVSASRTAEALWSDQAEWGRRVSEFAVLQLLATKNDFWLEEGEEDLTPVRFANAMILNSIVVDAEGGFEFWHDDRDLFWGHFIQVSGNLKEGPQYADIPG
jgi:hypothetical protein